MSFLQSTLECLENKDNQDAVNFLQNELCAYRDGNDPATSCALVDNTQQIEAVTESCFRWWLDGVTPDCPALLPNATTIPCVDALKGAVEEYGC